MKYVVIDYVDTPVLITDAVGNVRVFDEYSDAADAARDDATNGIIALLKKDATPLLRDFYAKFKEEVLDTIPEGQTFEESLENEDEEDAQLMIRVKELGE
jgi:hypothetical protein